MKTFRFHAQQGQEDQICRLLTANVSKPRVTRTEKGVMIEAKVPENMSKRSVDRMLFANNVPGAVNRTSPPILKGDKWDVMYDDRASDWFTWVDEHGKFRGVWRQAYYDYGCTCCGGYTTLQNKQGDYI
jgi:hypothetical protein